MISTVKFNRIVIKTSNYLKNQEIEWLDQNDQITKEKVYSKKYHIGDLYDNNQNVMSELNLYQAKILFSIVELIQNNLLIKIAMIQNILSKVEKDNIKLIQLYLLVRLALNNQYLTYLKNEKSKTVNAEFGKFFLIDLEQIEDIEITKINIDEEISRIKIYLLDYCGIAIKAV
jgi:hypothetical protein